MGINSLDSGQVAKCPVCNKKYRQNDAIVLASETEQGTFHFTCNKCKMASLVFITASQMGVVGVGVLTDLSKADVKKLFHKEPVSADNVLSVYDFFSSKKKREAQVQIGN